jgi:thiamine-phosphate diphosphorylase
MMVTDRHRLQARGAGARNEREEIDAVVEAAARAARCGATIVQVRERGLDDRALVELTTRVVQQSAASGVKVVVNDRIDVALAAGADGVHLPSSGAPAERVRLMAPAGFLIGRSVHAEAEAVAVAGTGACDYVIFGSVFPTESKPAGHTVAGTGALARVCAAAALPVIAIGGITPDRARDAARAGAAGVAAIGLFCSEDERAVRDAVRQIEDAFGAE